MEILQVLVIIICPIITYNQAKSKWLSTWRAIAWGIFFWLIAVLYYSLQKKSMEKMVDDEKKLAELRKQAGL